VSTQKKLLDLNPRWVSSGGAGVTRDGIPVPERNGIGIMCDCPCGCAQDLFVPFANPLDGHPSDYPSGWQREGNTFETLTLRPSILRSPKRGGCGWHGFLTLGVLETC